MLNETKTHEITVDTVILTIRNNALQVLLVKREKEPFIGKWAIPGGYVRMSENLEQAAVRVLKERTNVDNVYLEQLYTFGDPLRHPNSRVITCVYFALVRYEDVKTMVLTEDEVAWHSIDEMPPLAFDHKEIIDYTRARTRLSLKSCPVAYQLLKEKFTLTEMQRVYELIMGKELDKRNFRKKAITTDGLIELDEYTKSSSKRPARLYTFENIKLNSKRAHFIKGKAVK